jgi:two-component system chemotaxis response regulator CheB
MEKDKSLIYSGVVVIGGSAGSLSVLLNLLVDLNPRLMIPVIVVIHRMSSNDNMLVNLLQSKCKLKVREAEEKERLLPGVVYLCPADYHLLIESDRTISLDFSEKVNFSRPSIDVTLQSVAEVFGDGTVGILLSGANNDGTEGLRAVMEKGGITVAQCPADAEVDFMPKMAIDGGVVKYIINKEEIAEFINKLNPLIY